MANAAADTIHLWLLLRLLGVDDRRYIYEMIHRYALTHPEIARRRILGPREGSWAFRKAFTRRPLEGR